MIVSDYYNRKIPDYYDWMYLDGYTPEEVYYSFKRGIYEQTKERENTNEIKIISEVKIK